MARKPKPAAGRADVAKPARTARPAKASAKMAKPPAKIPKVPPGRPRRKMEFAVTCEGTSARTGEPCKMSRLLPGKLYGGQPASGRYCLNHAFANGEIPESATGPAAIKRIEAKLGHKIGGQKRLETPSELIRKIVRRRTEKFLKPYLDAVGLELVFDESGEPDVIEKQEGGARLYASEKGRVLLSEHADLETMQRAAERLLDRGFGKPVQTNLLGQADNHGPVEIDVPATADRLREVADVLKEIEGA